MSVLSVIPARGGSKGIPKKNVAMLNGRPLLAYTADAALASKKLDRVVLSTDDPEIAELGRELGLEVPYLRGAELARDETPMVDVLRDVLDTLDRERAEVTALVVLQPTSPLRTASDIDASVEMLLTRSAATVVSVATVPHHHHPLSVLRMFGDRVVPYLQDGPTPLRRQDKPSVVARNGPAVLVTRPAVIDSGMLYGEPTLGYHMPHARSVDIDGEFDLRLAGWLLREGTPDDPCP